MPKLKPKELESRRQELVDAARRCFMRDGFQGTTTRDICQEAGVTAGGLYHYFSNKEEIVAAVITDSVESAIRQMESITHEAGDLSSAFQDLATLFFQSMRGPDVDNATRLDIESWAEMLRNEKLAAITRDSWLRQRRWMESLIAQAKESGMYRPHVQARGLADLLLVILIGIRLGKLLWRDEFDLEGAMQSLAIMHAGDLTAEMPKIGPQAK